MKKNRPYFSSGRYWNKLVHKFYKINNRVTELLSKNSSSKTEVNILLDRLKKMYKKLTQLQVRAGVKIAGSALALMLATSSINAQNFVPNGQLLEIINTTTALPTFTDIDNNGNIDLYVGTNNGYVMHFTQDTNSTFSFADTLKNGSNFIKTNYYSSPAFADLDDDNDLDLFLGSGSGYILHYTNNAGNFTFSDTVKLNSSYIYNGYYSVIAFADLDNDADLDLYLGSEYGYIFEYKNNGSGIFTSMDTLKADNTNIQLNKYTAPAFADIDGDNDLDLVVGYYNNNGFLELYKNNGDGTFAAGITLQENNTDIAISDYPFPTFKDLDNDGDMDLFVGNEDGNIVILENDGSGNFSRNGYITSVISGTLTVPEFGDFNKDGKIDFLLGNGKEVIEYQNLGKDFFQQYRKITTPDKANPVLADLDSNGTKELFVGIQTGYIQIYSNNGYGSFTLTDSLSDINGKIKMPGYAAPVFEDIDNDSDLDLFIGEGIGYIYFYENDGSGNFIPQGKMQADGSDISVFYYSNPSFADIDYDGDMDLVVSDYYGYLWLYKNDGNGIFSADGNLKTNGNDLVVGYYSSITFAQIDSTSCRELYVGNNSGRIKVYHQTPFPVANTLPDTTTSCSFDTIHPPLAISSCFDTIQGTSNLTFPITANQTISWTYTDGIGFTTTQSQNAIVSDTENPVPNIANLPDIAVQCSVDTITPPTANDNCAGTITGTTPTTVPITNNTTITWTYDDGHGNSITQTQNVVINDTIKPAITCGTNQTVSADSSHTYTVNSTSFNPTNYSDNCTVDTVYNSFNNDSTLVGAKLPEGTTTITWYVKDANANIDSCSFDVIVNAFVGINELAEIGVNVYPNPTAGIINVQKAQGFDIEIIDINGKIIKSFGNINNDNFTIDMTNEEKGLYILKIFNDNTIKNIKILIK